MRARIRSASEALTAPTNSQPLPDASAADLMLRRVKSKDAVGTGNEPMSPGGAARAVKRDTAAFVKACASGGAVECREGQRLELQQELELLNHTTISGSGTISDKWIRIGRHDSTFDAGTHDEAVPLECTLSDVTLERCYVLVDGRGTVATLKNVRIKDSPSRGIFIERGGTLIYEGGSISGSWSCGVYATGQGSKADLTGVAVTSLSRSKQTGQCGIHAGHGSVITLRDCQVSSGVVAQFDDSGKQKRGKKKKKPVKKYGDSSTKGEYTGEYEGDFKQSGGRVVNETPEPAAALTKKEAKQEKKAAKKAAKKKSYRNLQRV